MTYKIIYINHYKALHMSNVDFGPFLYSSQCPLLERSLDMKNRHGIKSLCMYNHMANLLHQYTIIVFCI